MIAVLYIGNLTLLVPLSVYREIVNIAQYYDMWIVTSLVNSTVLAMFVVYRLLFSLNSSIKY